MALITRAKLWQIYLKKKVCIRREFSSPGNHAQNGKAERANRTIQETMRTILFASSLPSLWAEAASYAAYIYNRLPLADGTHRHHAALGHQRDTRKLHSFGCLAFVRNLYRRNKLDTWGIPKIHIGIASENLTAYRFIKLAPILPGCSVCTYDRDTVRFFDSIFPARNNFRDRRYYCGLLWTLNWIMTRTCLRLRLNLNKAHTPRLINCSLPRSLSSKEQTNREPLRNANGLPPRLAISYQRNTKPNSVETCNF
jgi:hypothetical protein